MSLFIPENQLRNMLQNQAAQSMLNSTDPLTRMVALNSLMQTQPQRQQNVNWLEDNWLDDNNLFG
jgi:hypothetical protein